MHSPAIFSAIAENTPQILHLPDGGMVLCEIWGDHIRLRDMHRGESITLSGVFAERLSRYLDDPATTHFPSFGPLARQYSWLAQLPEAQTPPPSDILLGKSLGMLFIELTDRCNESCIHCYAESSPQRTARLSREEIRRILGEARELGRPAVQFTGGDPLIHPDLVFAVQSARKLGYRKVEIYTNGLALSASLFSELLPFRPDFSFSVYAADASVHDSITQTPGSLARTVKAMLRVQDAGLSLRVGIILMAENRGTEDATMAFLQDELGLDPSQMGIDVVRSTGRGEFMRDDRPSATRLQAFRHRADTPQEETASTAKQASAPPVPARRGKLCISAQGDVFPCIFSRRTLLGNIRRQSLSEVLASLDQRALLQPSTGRWQQCRESLSCSDCQSIAYLLGDSKSDGQTVIPKIQGDAHAATATTEKNRQPEQRGTGGSG